MDLPGLLSQPFRQMHARTMKELGVARSQVSCRTGLTVLMATSNRTLVPVTIKVRGRNRVSGCVVNYLI